MLLHCEEYLILVMPIMQEDVAYKSSRGLRKCGEKSMMWLPNKITSHSGASARRRQMYLATKNSLQNLQSSPICMASREAPSTRFSS